MLHQSKSGSRSYLFSLFVLMMCSGVPGCNSSVTVPTSEGNSKAEADASKVKMQQIADGIRSHELKRRYFPKLYTTTADGQPGLSWRVAILPFIGEEELARQFNRNEPWDSEHNLKLLDKMPAVFQSPMCDVGPGKTVYLAVANGKGPMREENKLSISNIRDGTENTILFLEANADHAVEWTRPADLEVIDDDYATALGGFHPDSHFLAACCNGMVVYLPSTLENDLLKGFTTAGGREDIKIGDYSKR